MKSASIRKIHVLFLLLALAAFSVVTGEPAATPVPAGDGPPGSPPAAPAAAPTPPSVDRRPPDPGSAAPAPAADPELDALLEAVDRRAADVRDLRMRFEQDKFTPLLKKPMRSSGAILVMGGRTRWVTEAPHPSVMLIEGKTLRIYYPEQKLLEVYDVDRRLGELAASPLPRLPVLRKYFDIERVREPDAPSGAGGDPRPLALRLVPKADGLREHVAEVRVTLDPATGLARAVEMKDPDGDRTVLRFSRPEINRGLKDEFFELSVPEGTTVTRPLEKL